MSPHNPILRPNFFGAAFFVRRKWMVLQTMTTPPFLYLNTREELATVLECKDAALDFVSLCTPEKPCKTAGCDYPAADHNYNKCLVHGRWWIPTKHTSTDGCIRHDRGHMLLGPEFSIAQNPGAKACCCDMASCKGIGYTRCSPSRPGLGKYRF